MKKFEINENGLSCVIVRGIEKYLKDYKKLLL